MGGGGGGGGVKHVKPNLRITHGLIEQDKCRSDKIMIYEPL